MEVQEGRRDSIARLGWRGRYVSFYFQGGHQFARVEFSAHRLNEGMSTAHEQLSWNRQGDYFHSKSTFWPGRLRALLRKRPNNV